MTIAPPLLSYAFDRATVATIESGTVDRVDGPFAGFLGAAVRATGSGRVQVPVASLPIGATAGTWVAFVKFDDAATLAGDRYLASWGAAAGDRLQLFYRARDDKFVMRSNNGSNDDAASAAQTFGAGAALMVAGIVTATDVKVRVGTEATVALGSRPGGVPAPTEANINLGTDSAGASPLKGIAGIVLFYPRELATDELDYLAGLLTAGRPPGAYELYSGGASSEQVARWYGALEEVEHGTVFGLYDTATQPEIGLLNMRGAGMPAIIINTSDSPFRDGKLPPDEAVLGERFLTADLELYGEDQGSGAWARLQELRNAIAGALNPRNGLGLVTFVPDAAAYVIEAFHSGGMPLDDQFIERFQRTSPIFQCPDPAWRLATKDVERLSVMAGGLDVGVDVPVDLAAVSGNTATIVNTGADRLPSRPLVRIKGHVQNPVIWNTTTGKVVALLTTVEAGEVLLLDMDALTAELADGTNRIGQRTAASEFWELERGSNTVEVDYLATLNEPRTVTVDLIYDMRLIGV